MSDPKPTTGRNDREGEMTTSVPQSTIDKLLELRQEFEQRAHSVDADVHHKNDPVEKDFAEQVTQRENDDVLSALGDEAKHNIQLIDNALRKIKDGSYGFCDVCGEPIPEPRLKALPYATTCIQCAEKLG
jgi:DnaK suppressor protein